MDYYGPEKAAQEALSARIERDRLRREQEYQRERRQPQYYTRDEQMKADAAAFLFHTLLWGPVIVFVILLLSSL